MILTQTYTAVGPGITSSFLAVGGTPPYVFSIVPGGAGGSINASGLYTAPATFNQSPLFFYDTIQAVDSLLNVATAKILVGPPLILFCDIIQTYMGLANDHIFLWDQKIFQPTDSGLYIIVSVESAKVIGNIQETNNTAGTITQGVNMFNQLGVNMISKSTDAIFKKELVVAALNSNYANRQMEANSFFIGRNPTQFTNLSGLDGASIPYRFHFSVGFQYLVKNTLPNQYFDNIQTPFVVEDP